MSTGTETLRDLVARGDLERLEEAWLASLEGDLSDIEGHLEAARACLAREQGEGCVPLLLLLAENLAEKERHDDALRALDIAARSGREITKVRSALIREAEAVHGGDPWRRVLLARADLDGTTYLPDAWKRFGELLRIHPGRAVFHRNGWDEGIVDEVDPAAARVKIRFGSGMVRDFPVGAITGAFDILDDDDLRAIFIRDPEELQRLVREDPLAVLRRTVALHGGKTSSTEIRATLRGKIVSDAGWPGFLRVAKAAAKKDPMIAVEGTSARPVFVLRERPVSPAEEIAMAISRADTLAGAVAICRSRRNEITGEDRLAVLRQLKERVDRQAEKIAARTPAVLLDAHFLLESEGVEDGGGARELLRASIEDASGAQPGESPGRRLARLLQAMPSARGADALLDALPEALGEDWVGISLVAVGAIRENLCEEIVERVLAAGQPDRVAAAFHVLLRSHEPNPGALLAFARIWHRSRALSREKEAPGAGRILRGVVGLAKRLAVRMRGVGRDEARKNLRRIETVLLARNGALFHRLLEDATREDLEVVVSFLGDPDPLPDEIDDPIRAVADRRFPELFNKHATRRGFWQSDRIFTTREGLARQRERLRELVEEKIPENSMAIGRARELGDLAENHEWKAAIEEQKNLTELAGRLQEELERAKLLEEQPVPPGVATPGCRVRYRELSSGEERKVSILGPWDTGPDGVISYKTPIAQGLLGRHKGDQAELHLPEGKIVVKILDVERLAAAP